MADFHETTRELIGWVSGISTGRKRLERGEVIGLLSALADEGEVRAVPYFLPYVLDEDLVVARGAARALERLLDGVGTEDCFWLDRHLRGICGRWYGLGLARRLHKRDVRRLAERTDHAAAVYGILSLHWNGYAREEAVRRLGGCEPGRAVPFVLLRLNDWVREVREAASVVVAEWLERGELLPLALNLPLVERMAGPVRGRREELVEEIEARLLAEAPPTALREACRSGDRSVRRQAFALALGAATSGDGWAIEEGLASPDPVIRLRALRLIAGDGEPEVHLERVRRMLDDPFMPVRREALQALAVAAPEAGREALERAVLDRHPAIRYVARWHLARVGVKGFAGLYREVLEAAPSRDQAVAALGGLGEVGEEEDVLLAAPYLEDPTVRVRAAAVRAWSKLGGDAEVWGLLELVLDESPKVAREAVRAVRERLHLVGVERLLGCYFRAGRAHARREVLHLMVRLPVGKGLRGLLRVGALQGDGLADEALGLVGESLGRANRGAVEWSASEVAAVRRGMEAVGERLGEGVREQVELLLRGCSG